MTAPPLWHGGAPGRNVGDLLLPPSVTGIPSLLHQRSLRDGTPHIGQRANRVYVTTARDWAWAFASMWQETEDSPRGGGSLYRVTVENSEPDADFLSLNGVSLQTPRALVVEVPIICVGFNQRRCRQILEKYIAQHQAARAAQRLAR